MLAADDGGTDCLVFGWPGPRLLPAGEGLAALARAEGMWGEHDRSHAGHIALPALTRWLRGGPSPGRVVEPRRGRIRAALGALGHLGLRRGRNPVGSAARGAVYLNATHFPLDWPSHVAWLDRRSDIRPVVFVHDMLPLDHPAFFWPGETERHRARLALLARRGAGAIVTTRAVASRLQGELAAAGRGDMPILQATPPVPALFHTRPAPDPALAELTFFVCCGTVEPRKNHRLLLRVWRRLVAAQGAAAPKLVVVGKRGWLCDAIVADLQDPALARHVVEVTSLTSRDYKLLLDHARALLAPSLAEGFGLPVAEALAGGTPVIASDIPAFREQRTDGLTLIDPEAEDLWYEAIGASAEAQAPRMSHGAIAPERYLATVRQFLAACG